MACVRLPRHPPRAHGAIAHQVPYRHPGAFPAAADRLDWLRSSLAAPIGLPPWLHPSRPFSAPWNCTGKDGCARRSTPTTASGPLCRIMPAPCITPRSSCTRLASTRPPCHGCDVPSPSTRNRATPGRTSAWSVTRWGALGDALAALAEATRRSPSDPAVWETLAVRTALRPFLTRPAAAMRRRRGTGAWVQPSARHGCG